ncbi:MAG: protease [Ponticaulis sp.]|nr:protease [Ponticaulis sp.]
MTATEKVKRVAILVTHGFEEIELTSPRKALTNAGFETQIVSPEEGQIQAHNGRHQGKWHDVEMPLKFARAENFDALLIPGGLFSPDKLRKDDTVLEFVRHFTDSDKPVFAICHGPQLLISARVVEGRQMTGYTSIQLDLHNAGAIVSDKPVVADGNFVTSRNPEDLDYFNRSIIEMLRAEKADQSKAA